MNFLILTSLFAASALAIEVDNTTLRYEPLEDGTAILDAEINSKLKSAIAESTTCDRPTLYNSVKNQFFQPFYGSQMETFAHFSGKVPLLSMYGKKNIYNYFESTQEAAFALAAAPGLYSPFGLSIADLIKVNGVMIGADKIGHFFSMGYRYFSRAHDLRSGVEKSGELEKALDYGQETEDWFYGRVGSGVYSYADLTANYEGLQFWKNLLDGESPYIRCKAGNFVLAREFSLNEYATPGWDEGINCSDFTSDTVRTVVQRARLELTLTHKKRYICPASQSACADLLDKYPDPKLQNRLLSPECRNAGAIHKYRVSQKR